MTDTAADNPRSPLTGLRSRGPAISRNAPGQFAVANASELHVGTRVKVWASAISRLAGKRGRVVRVLSPGLCRVETDCGLVGMVSCRDLALEKKL